MVAAWGSNIRSTHYKYARTPLSPRSAIHPCTSKCSPCSESDSVELHWRPEGGHGLGVRGLGRGLGLRPRCKTSVFEPTQSVSVVRMSEASPREAPSSPSRLAGSDRWAVLPAGSAQDA